MDDFSKVFDTNFRGPALMIKAVIPVIRKGGRIINVSSRGAKTSAGGPMALYCASKAALHSITKSVSNEFGVSKGITCNTLMPGHTDTDMMSGSTDSDYRKWAESLPTSEKRLGTTDDMAQIAGWLAAEESRWINGDTISATGGSWMP